MTGIGIFGTSGLAGEVGDIADALGLTAIYVARDAAELVSWSSDQLAIVEADVADHTDLMFVVGIGDSLIRRRVVERFASTLQFGNLLHPAATFGRNQRSAVEHGIGNVVAAGVQMSNTITVGNFCIVNANATIGHDVIIEDFVTICPGATISGNVQLAAGAWIGAGAVINQGDRDRKLTIGTGAVIGSGAVVTRDCEAGGTYAGVPARRLR